jgi:ribosomal protein L32
MIRYEDDCVGCPQGCINCGRRHMPHLYCDECGDEISADDMYKVDDKMLCRECVLYMFKADWTDFE